MRARVLAAALLLAGCGGAAVFDEEEAWSPLRRDSPIFSVGSGVPGPGYGGSALTVPRVTGAPLAPIPLTEEPGNIWPGREPPRTTLTDPDAVARGIPNYRPGGLRAPGLPEEPPDARSPLMPPEPGAARRRRGAAPPPLREGEVIPRPDGLPAIGGAGTEGAGTYVVPGRPGVGTVIPDGRGGRILLEPGGGTIIAPR